MGRRIRVASLQEIEPGKGKLIRAEGRSIALFSLAGSIRAIDAVCPHRGGPLEEGDVEGETVVCPWHAYDFSLHTGESQVAPDLRAETFPVAVEGDDVFVELPDTP
jgi:nitrite reductase/ring-hydroxylating ferredoxin subunit